jgi:GT2 family glycosyltransferase
VNAATVPVSVIVCTRDRPDDLQRCLDSLAVLDPQPLEVVVIDQGSTRFKPAGKPRIRHHIMNERGLSLARNRGLSLAYAYVVAFLDDDCVVESKWAADVASVFVHHPDADLAFGSVVASNTDLDEYVPAYSIARERRLKGRMSATGAHGIGAAMYLRKAAAAAIGGFDPRLGAGGEFRSSEDWDFTFRALAAGAVVIETPRIVVHHFGARRYSDGSASQLLRWNALSHGAVHAKLLRCADPIGLVLVATELASLVVLVRPFNALLGRPTNAARLGMYVKGLIAGSRVPLRRTERLFAEPAA